MCSILLSRNHVSSLQESDVGFLFVWIIGGWDYGDQMVKAVKLSTSVFMGALFKMILLLPRRLLIHLKVVEVIKSSGNLLLIILGFLVLSYLQLSSAVIRAISRVGRSCQPTHGPRAHDTIPRHATSTPYFHSPKSYRKNPKKSRDLD